MEITKEQIKEAYQRPELLKELFPKAFELELNRWYKSTEKGDECLFYLERIENHGLNRAVSYGFDMAMGWSDSIGRSLDFFEQSTRLATEEEVTEALTKEAVKRGFLKGAKFKSIDYNLNEKLEIIGSIDFDIDNNDLHISTYSNLMWRSVFLNGEWAEIIKERTVKKVTLKDVAKKYGVDKVIITE